MHSPPYYISGTVFQDKNFLTFFPRGPFPLGFPDGAAICEGGSGSSYLSGSLCTGAVAAFTGAAACFTGLVFTGFAGNNALLFSSIATTASLEEG